MARLLPFVGHVVAGAGARAVVAPPYDALTPDQRAAMAAADPRSFLNVLPPGPAASADLEHTLHACRRSLDRLLGDGHYEAIPGVALAIVAIGSGADRVTAIVGDLPAADFAADAGRDRILPHERVDPTRVAQLVRYLEVVGIASSPVALAHRPHPAATAATTAATTGPPAVAYRDEQGIDVALWLVTDPGLQAALIGGVEAAGRLYLADGHHRAAAVDVHEPGTGRVLSALLPTDRVQILPFHRRLHGLGDPDVDAATVVDLLRRRDLPVTRLPAAATPTGRGRIHLAVGGAWWALDLRDRVDDHDPVEALDVRLAEREVIAPLLAAGDRRSDARVVAVPAPLGLDALVAPDVVGVVLAPPLLEDVLRVAEAGAVMPPKTTYILPKLRSGLLIAPR